VRLRTKVRSLSRGETGWRLECEADGARWTEQFDAVVCAIPAVALANLPIDGVPGAEQLAAVREIEHPPVASIFTGFKRADVQHPLDGFGVLMPQVEQGRILGTLFSSTLFPGRAPKDHVALTTFVGGMRQPELIALDDHDLVRVVRDQLHQLLGLRAAPTFVRIQRWPRAIPQYHLGYQRYKDVIAAVEKSGPGLFIGGNCRDGISLANCLASGQRLAREVIAAEKRSSRIAATI
jgi:protoporphyrinogen/coproporphyrinogen III oxidase